MQWEPPFWQPPLRLEELSDGPAGSRHLGIKWLQRKLTGNPVTGIFQHERLQRDVVARVNKMFDNGHVNTNRSLGHRPAVDFPQRPRAIDGDGDGAAAVRPTITREPA